MTLCSCFKEVSQSHFSETVKVALRDVGNMLLHSNNDSTSLVLPISKLSDNRYELTFQSKLSITPDSLVSAVNHSLKTANLPKRYIVEVVHCGTKEVSYSFQIEGTSENDIVPCMGRNLPLDCYNIRIHFLEKQFTLEYIALLLFFSVLIMLLFYFKTRHKHHPNEIVNFSRIGDYKFYKDQNKLIKEAIEIKLSKKECELISILGAHVNEVVKRETLVKEIWEDHGVFVDRSLDTFISKLRKKFKDDDSINIINVHSVGYKLEVL